MIHDKLSLHKFFCIVNQSASASVVPVLFVSLLSSKKSTQLASHATTFPTRVSFFGLTSAFQALFSTPHAPSFPSHTDCSSLKNMTATHK